MNGAPPNPSGYDRDLFERVLLGITDAVERVRTILLWRGFLVRRDGDGMFLRTGSAQDDFTFLQRQGLTLHPIAGHKENYAEIPHPEAIPDTILFQLFNHTPHRPTGPFGFDSDFKQNRATFITRKFGPKIPVELIDPGVALLVKVLPHLGLHVLDACDGHLTEPPLIRLLSVFDLKWARDALPRFAPKGDRFAKQWVFERRRWNAIRWDYREPIGQWFLGSNGCGKSLDERYSFYKNDIQRLAQKIMTDEQLVSRLREYRNIPDRQIPVDLWSSS